jgi:hypothetical protein
MCWWMPCMQHQRVVWSTCRLHITMAKCDLIKSIALMHLTVAHRWHLVVPQWAAPVLWQTCNPALQTNTCAAKLCCVIHCILQPAPGRLHCVPAVLSLANG